jgi:hypothetical protein
MTWRKPRQYSHQSVRRFFQGLKWIAVKYGLRFAWRRVVVSERNGDFGNERRAIDVGRARIRAPSLSDELCAELMKHLGNTVHPPWRLHHDHQVFWTGRFPRCNLQACAR